MNIGVIGINHKSGDTALREKIAQACSALFTPISQICNRFSYVFLLTCNRCELYFFSHDLPATHSSILDSLKDQITEEFTPYLYSYFGDHCFLHLAKVTAGLDSALFGETEIQGQVKNAYLAATTSRALPHELHFLFQKSLKIGKKIRSYLPQTQGICDLEKAIKEIATRKIGRLEGKKLLFVGASEINRKLFMHLKNYGLKQIAFCNRSSNLSPFFEKQDEITWLSWERLSCWDTFDLTLFGTKAPHYLVTPNTLSPSLKTPRLLIDLALPRNVDPQVGSHPCISLVHLDELHTQIAQKPPFLKESLNADITTTVANHISRFRSTSLCSV